MTKYVYDLMPSHLLGSEFCNLIEASRRLKTRNFKIWDKKEKEGTQRRYKEN